MILGQKFTSQTSVSSSVKWGDYFLTLASLKGLGLEGLNKKNHMTVFFKYKMLDISPKLLEFKHLCG